MKLIFKKYLTLHILIVFFSSTIAENNNATKDLPEKEELRANFNPIKDILPLTRPFIMSGSVEKIIQFLKAFPPESSFIISEQIIKEKESSLSNDDKIQLLFGLAQAFKEYPAKQKKLFNLLFVLDKKIPAMRLVQAAKYGYNEIIPALVRWAQEQKKKHAELNNFALKSLYRSIDANDSKAFKILAELAINLDKKTASNLLWHTVSQNHNTQFIPILADYNADLWSTNKGHTLVTKATELNNKEIIKTLIATLKKGGSSGEKINKYLNRFADKTVGSPIQIAIEKGFTDLEIYLREQGATE